MAIVVSVAWQSLTILTEIKVITDSAFVTGSADKRLVFRSTAERSITVDAIVTNGSRAGSSEGIVQRCETMTFMNILHILDTFRAKVIIWAVKAFVTDTKDGLTLISIFFEGMNGNNEDYLIAAITASSVVLVTVSMATGFRGGAKLQSWIDWLEFVCWVVAMFHAIVAGQAEIVVIAACAMDEVVLFKYYDRLSG